MTIFRGFEGRSGGDCGGRNGVVCLQGRATSSPTASETYVGCLGTGPDGTGDAPPEQGRRRVPGRGYLDAPAPGSGPAPAPNRDARGTPRPGPPPRPTAVSPSNHTNSPPLLQRDNTIYIGKDENFWGMTGFDRRNRLFLIT